MKAGTIYSLKMGNSPYNSLLAFYTFMKLQAL